MKKLIYVALAVSLLFMSGCTDGKMAKFKALGGSARVTCYSGDRLIYDGYSTGKVSSPENSDGYYFVDKSDKKLKEVSGNCVITYEKY